MQKMVIFIKANTYNTANLSKLGPRVVAHIILSHPNGCGVPCLGLGVMSHKCLFAGPWGLIVIIARTSERRMERRTFTK
jgi:hypothetical protein